MSIADKLKADQKSEHARQGGGWYKIQEGANKLRILVEPVAMYEDYKYGICYTNCGFKGSIKYLGYVLDYIDNTVKLYKIPFTIMNTISAFETSEDYAFAGFPMPYDIIINAKNAGDKSVEYTVVPRPVRTDVDINILDALKKKKSPTEVIQVLKERNIEKHKADGTFDKFVQEAEALKKQLGEARTGTGTAKVADTGMEYPEEEINPNDIPF